MVGSVVLTLVKMMQPLPTKLNLRKKRAREGRSNEDVEHFPVPSRLTVRRRPSVAVIELNDAGVRWNSIFKLTFHIRFCFGIHLTY